jgi:2-polyprenyl-6-methoxyphenol hydroxylase-like FAD-dependent oxidoreductase
MDADVLIVGAGPTGLMLACELALGGVRAMVVDRLGGRSRQSKAGGLQPRTSEILDMRDLFESAERKALNAGQLGSHFAALPIPLDCRPWGTRHPWPVAVPQARLEDILEERFLELGGEVLRSQELVALGRGEGGVIATLDGPSGSRPVEAGWLAGCDGGHSTARRLIGVGFPGRAGTHSMVLSDVVVAGPEELVGREPRHFSNRVRAEADRWAVLAPAESGLHRFMFGGPEQSSLARDAPVEEAEVQEALRASYGEELKLVELRAGSRFTDASRQVDRYRVGRVFLAGDAAHVHSPLGGQGLNLGVQDAFNLGWKLAAEVRGRAPAGLLDTYEEERHPVGARVLHNTRAQSALNRNIGDEEVTALRELFSDLMRMPDVNRHLSGMTSGLDVRYPVPEGAPDLVGRRAPDPDLETSGRTVRLSSLMRTGHGLLLDLGCGAADSAVPDDRVDVVRAVGRDPELPSGMLVRPDGYVCWTPAAGTLDGLGVARERWFGPPVAMASTPPIADTGR